LLETASCNHRNRAVLYSRTCKCATKGVLNFQTGTLWPKNAAFVWY